MSNPENANLLREQAQLQTEMQLPEGDVSTYRMWCDGNSPYSWKLRSYMHYKGIPYQRMRSNMTAYMSLIPEKVGMSIIPVLLTPDDQVLQDSTPIMQRFEQQYPQRASVPDDPALEFLMWLLEDFGDEYLVRFAMHYRWGNDLNRQALSHRLARSMCYGVPEAHPTQLAPMVLDRQSGFDLPLGLSDADSRRSLDEQLLELLGILDLHFEQFQFLLGDRPSLADFAVFGQLYAHLYQDPFSAELMERHGARTCNWIETLLELGDTRGAVGQTAFGDWLDLAAGVPDSLRRLLNFVAKTYLPYSAGTARTLAAGEKQFSVKIFGVASRFVAAQYKAWSFEQVQLRLQALAPNVREQLDSVLAASGLLPGLMADGIYHVSLFDGFTPPLVKDGVADAKLRYLRDKQANSG